MTEGETPVGRIYRLAAYPSGATYKKISETVTVPVDKDGRQIGKAENVHPFDQVTIA